jgi:hypothetical protein
MTPTSNTNIETKDPDELLQSIRTRNLIAVTGTGFSCLASENPSIDNHQVATWPGLLEHGFQYCIANGLQGAGSTRDVRVQLAEKQTRQLIGAASTILGWLGEGASSHRQKWLNSSIGRLQLKDRGLVRALKLLSPGVLLTLNYDDLLEQGTQYPALDWTEHDLIAAVLRNDASPHVIHLHGYWKKAENVIADFFSYRDITKDPSARGLMHQLFIYHRLLFVGCRGTFEDPHFKQVMNDISQAGVGYSHNHYVLCRNCDLDEVRTLLAATGMFRPLVYGASYQELTPFLDRLARNAGIELEDDALSSLAIGTPRQKRPLRFRRAGEVWTRQVND